MQANDTKNENPYVAVVAKKYRNLKKKLDKIVKIEEKKASGKTLQAEELDLLGAKGSVERSIGDIKAIKEQLEDVSKLFEAVSISTQQHQTREEETQQSVEDNKAEQVTTSTQCEVEETPAAETPDVTSPPPPLVLNFDVEIKKLLKALHVYQRYKDVTARPLPDNVDYFGKTLLGQTSISAFPDTLSSSCRVANLYLNEENTEILRGVTYAQMSLYIDQLADEMERCHVRGTTAGLTALLRNTISPAFNSSPSAPSPGFMESEFNSFSTGINLLSSEYNSFNHMYYPPAAAVGPAPVAVAPVPVSAPALEVAAPTIPPAPEMVPVESATTTAVEESPAVAAEEAGGKKARGPRTRRGRGEEGEKRERRRERKPREESKATEESASLAPAAPTPSVATTPAPASSPVAAVPELPSPPALAPVTNEEPQTTTIPAAKPRRERKPREKPVRAAPAVQSIPAVEAPTVTSPPVPAPATSAVAAPVVEAAAPTSAEKPVKEERKREKKREREPKHKEVKPVETAQAPAAEVQSVPAATPTVPPAPVVEQAPSAAPAPAPAPRKPISYAAAVEPAIAPKPVPISKPAEVGENNEKTRKEFRGERKPRNDLGGDRSSDRSPREERSRRGRGEGGSDRDHSKDGAERSERKSPRAVREARGDKQAVNSGNARRAAPSTRPSNK